MLPSTVYSEIVEMTPAQSAKVQELIKCGWQQITNAEGTFNGSLIMESPDGNNHFVFPNGEISKGNQ